MPLILAANLCSMDQLSIAPFASGLVFGYHVKTI
jgi:hypothetical protein